jgi:hypothetical protein
MKANDDQSSPSFSQSRIRLLSLAAISLAKPPASLQRLCTDRVWRGILRVVWSATGSVVVDLEEWKRVVDPLCTITCELREVVRVQRSEVVSSFCGVGVRHYVRQSYGCRHQ